MSIAGTAATAFSHYYVPELFYWLLPITLPLVIAPLLVWLTASVWLGNLTRNLGLFAVPTETVQVDVASDMHMALQQQAAA
jgi:membrane glycosyltransferase